MTGPVTGPIYRNVGSGQDLYIRTVSYRQKPPYDLRLAYTSRNQRCLNRTGGLTSSASGKYYGTGGDPVYSEVINESYRKLVSALGPSAGLGTSIVEWEQSASMIAKRGLQLAGFTRAIARGRFGDAAAYLSTQPLRPPKGFKAMNRSQRIASGYLEYSFGWAPLAGDLVSSAKVLSAPVKDRTVRGFHQAAPFYWTRRQTPAPPSGSASQEDNYSVMSCLQICDIAVTNPNLALANSLGLLNPLQIAADVVPFSFILGWFVNYSDILGSMTDFAGLSVKNPATSITTRLHTYEWWKNANNAPVTKTATFQSDYFERKTGLSKPVLEVSARRFGLNQAKYSIALLVQALKGA